MEENKQEQNQPGEASSEKENVQPENSPLPPKPSSGEEEKKRVEVHTLKSDLEKLKESGGEMDFSSSLEGEKKEEAFSPPPFSPDKVQEVKSEGLEPLEGGEESQKGKKGRKLVYEGVGGAILVLIVGALLGYFWYYPKHKKTAHAPISTPVAQNTPQPSVSPKPSPTPPAMEKYVSLFARADKVVKIDLPLLSSVTLKNQLSQEAQETESTGTFKEVILTRKKRIVAFPDFLETIVPDLSPLASKKNVNLADVFEDGFSLAIIYLDNGPQLVYLGRIKNGETDSARALISSLVKEADIGSKLKNSHFFVDPGSPDSGGFRNGQLDQVQTFYLPYTNNNLAFNFGFSPDNYFMVFTSKSAYDALVSRIKKVAVSNGSSNAPASSSVSSTSSSVSGTSSSL